MQLASGEPPAFTLYIYKIIYMVYDHLSGYGNHWKSLQWLFKPLWTDGWPSPKWVYQPISDCSWGTLRLYIPLYLHKYPIKIHICHGCSSNFEPQRAAPRGRSCAENPPTGTFSKPRDGDGKPGCTWGVHHGELKHHKLRHKAYNYDKIHLQLMQLELTSFSYAMIFWVHYGSFSQIAMENQSRLAFPCEKHVSLKQRNHIKYRIHIKS